MTTTVYEREICLADVVYSMFYVCVQNSLELFKFYVVSSSLRLDLVAGWIMDSTTNMEYRKVLRGRRRLENGRREGCAIWPEVKALNLDQSIWFHIPSFSSDHRNIFPR